MVFIVALYVPWCTCLADQGGVALQLYADNLDCTTSEEGALLRAARSTDGYVRAVGQAVFPSKCVLLSTPKAARKRRKMWTISLGDKGWAVKLDFRALGCDSAGASWHPLQPCWSGYLSGSFGQCAPAWVTCAEWLPAGLHGSEGAAVSGEILVEACWPRKRPMADPFDVLSFLDAPDCCDSAFVVYGADLGK